MNTVDFGPAAQRLARLVARVEDDEMGRPTPLPAYTLGDLIEHVGGVALAFTTAANKDVGSPYVGPPPPGDASRLGADWRTRIPAPARGARPGLAGTGRRQWTAATMVVPSLVLRPEGRPHQVAHSSIARASRS